MIDMHFSLWNISVSFNFLQTTKAAHFNKHPVVTHEQDHVEWSNKTRNEWSCF